MGRSWDWSDIEGGAAWRQPKAPTGRRRGERTPVADEAIRLVESGLTYSRAAVQLGLTRCQVAGFVYRAKRAK